MYTLQKLSESSTEPVSVAELKAHLRLNDTSEDSMLGDFITTARVLFEELTGRALVATTFRQYVSSLGGNYQSQQNRPHTVIEDIYPYAMGSRIYLMRHPVLSFVSLTYYDGSGTQQTANPSTYSVDLVSCPASVWMTTVPVLSYLRTPAVWVDYTAGYGVVPAPIRQAIKLLAAHYYQSREAYQSASLEGIPQGFAAMVSLYRTGLTGSWGM